jgi:hypothetical protein
MVDLAAQVERARQCWNNGDLDGYLSLYDDASKLHGYSPEPMKKAEVRAFYQQVCASLAEEGYRNPILAFHEIMTGGDLYCCRFTMRGVPSRAVPRRARDRPSVLDRRDHDDAVLR